MSIRVLLADDSEIVRQAITSVLMGDPEIQLVGEAVTFAQAIKLTHELQPRVILIDLHMRDRDGVTPLHVKASLAGSRLLAMSFQNDDEAKALADSFGAVAFLDKMSLSAELIPAIKLYAADNGSSGQSDRLLPQG